MNKEEFIQKIILRHATNMNPEQMTALQEDYTTVLEDNTDFDSLFRVYLDEYQNKTFPPPAWFKQRAKKKFNPTSCKELDIRDIYFRLPNGLSYQAAYIYPEETEYMAKQAIRERFNSVEFITKEEYKATY